MSTTHDDTRTRTMLLARARGRQDALAEEWGERPERPPRSAERDVSSAVPPADVGRFTADAYPWRVDVAVTDDAGRVRLVLDGDDWRLPGGAGSRTETVERVAERHAARAVGADVALTDLLWTQLVEFDYGTVALPALRVVFRGDLLGTAADGEWFDTDALPAALAAADADALRDCL